MQGDQASDAKDTLVPSKSNALSVIKGELSESAQRVLESYSSYTSVVPGKSELNPSDTQNLANAIDIMLSHKDGNYVKRGFTDFYLSNSAEILLKNFSNLGDTVQKALINKILKIGSGDKNPEFIKQAFDLLKIHTAAIRVLNEKPEFSIPPQLRVMIQADTIFEYQKREGLIQDQLTNFYENNSKSVPIELLHCCVEKFLDSVDVKNYLSLGGDDVPSLDNPDFSDEPYTIGTNVKEDETLVYKAGNFYKVPKVDALSLDALIKKREKVPGQISDLLGGDSLDTDPFIETSKSFQRKERFTLRETQPEKVVLIKQEERLGEGKTKIVTVAKCQFERDTLTLKETFTPEDYNEILNILEKNKGIKSIKGDFTLPGGSLGKLFEAGIKKFENTQDLISFELDKETLTLSGNFKAKDYTELTGILESISGDGKQDKIKKIVLGDGIENIPMNILGAMRTAGINEITKSSGESCFIKVIANENLKLCGEGESHFMIGKGSVEGNPFKLEASFTDMSGQVFEAILKDFKAEGILQEDDKVTMRRSSVLNWTGNFPVDKTKKGNNFEIIEGNILNSCTGTCYFQHRIQPDKSYDKYDIRFSVETGKKGTCRDKKKCFEDLDQAYNYFRTGDYPVTPLSSNTSYNMNSPWPESTITLAKLLCELGADIEKQNKAAVDKSKDRVDKSKDTRRSLLLAIHRHSKALTDDQKTQLQSKYNDIAEKVNGGDYQHETKGLFNPMKQLLLLKLFNAQGQERADTPMRSNFLRSDFRYVSANRESESQVENVSGENVQCDAQDAFYCLNNLSRNADKAYTRWQRSAGGFIKKKIPQTITDVLDYLKEWGGQDDRRRNNYDQEIEGVLSLPKMRGTSNPPAQAGVAAALLGTTLPKIPPRVDYKAPSDLGDQKRKHFLGLLEGGSYKMLKDYIDETLTKSGTHSERSDQVALLHLILADNNGTLVKDGSLQNAQLIASCLEEALGIGWRTNRLKDALIAVPDGTKSEDENPLESLFNTLSGEAKEPWLKQFLKNCANKNFNKDAMGPVVKILEHPQVQKLLQSKRVLKTLASDKGFEAFLANKKNKDLFKSTSLDFLVKGHQVNHENRFKLLAIQAGEGNRGVLEDLKAMVKPQLSVSDLGALIVSSVKNTSKTFQQHLSEKELVLDGEANLQKINQELKDRGSRSDLSFHLKNTLMILHEDLKELSMNSPSEYFGVARHNLSQFFGKDSLDQERISAILQNTDLKKAERTFLNQLVNFYQLYKQLDQHMAWEEDLKDEKPAFEKQITMLVNPGVQFDHAMMGILITKISCSYSEVPVEDTGSVVEGTKSAEAVFNLEKCQEMEKATRIDKNKDEIQKSTQDLYKNSQEGAVAWCDRPVEDLCEPSRQRKEFEKLRQGLNGDETNSSAYAVLCHMKSWMRHTSNCKGRVDSLKLAYERYEQIECLASICAEPLKSKLQTLSKKINQKINQAVGHNYSDYKVESELIGTLDTIIEGSLGLQDDEISSVQQTFCNALSGFLDVGSLPKDEAYFMDGLTSMELPEVEIDSFEAIEKKVLGEYADFLKIFFKSRAVNFEELAKDVNDIDWGALKDEINKNQLAKSLYELLQRGGGPTRIIARGN